MLKKKQHRKKPISTSETYCIVLFIGRNKTYLHKYSLNSLLLRWSNPLRINLAAILSLLAGFLWRKLWVHFIPDTVNCLQLKWWSAVVSRQRLSRYHATGLRSSRSQKGRSNIKEVGRSYIAGVDRGSNTHDCWTAVCHWILHVR